MKILLLQSSHCVVNGTASKCGPCILFGTNQHTPSMSHSKSTTPTYQYPIQFFFTISQICTPPDQTLIILASSVSPRDFLRQTLSLSAASPDLCSRKSTRWPLTLFDSLNSTTQRTLPFPNFFKTRKRLSTDKTKMRTVSVTRSPQHTIQLIRILIDLKSI